MGLLSKATSAVRLVSPVARDPLRQALADAIAEGVRIDADIAKAAADRDKGRQLEATCRERLDKAHAAVEEAKATRAARIMTAVETDQPIGPDTVLRDAVAVEADELYALEVVEAGIARAEALLSEAQERRGKVSDKVRSAASQVLVVDIADIAGEIDRTHKHLIKLIWIMRFLAKHTLPGPGSFADAYNIINSFGNLQGVNDESTGLQHAAEPWRAVYEALQVDPDARLPSVIAA